MPRRTLTVLIPLRWARTAKPHDNLSGIWNFAFITRSKREQGHTVELHPNGYEKDTGMRRRMMTVAVWLLLVLIVGNPLSGSGTRPAPFLE